MKIMLQNHTFYPILGGIENYLYYVSKTFIEKGHKPVILCERHDDKLSAIDNYEGIKIIRHPYYNIPKRMLFMKPKIIAEKLKCFISKHIAEMDFIISRYPYYCFATCSLHLDTPIFFIPPSVFWRQLREASSDVSLKTTFFNYVWKKSFDHMERQSILKSDRTIVLSKNVATSLKYYYRSNELQLDIIPPGVDLQKFAKTKDLQLIKELKINRKNIILLYVGRLSPEKNVGRLIKEFQFLGRNDVTLLIVGYGVDRERLERMKGTLGLEGEVLFLGPRTDVERFYSIADVFISPSKHEPFGQVILEAMAAGLPCIAFKRVPPEYEVAAEEMIEDGVTGYCVNPYERNEFRERLCYLIERPDVRKRMGEAGREVVERKFTWEGHVRTLLDLAKSQLSKS